MARSRLLAMTMLCVVTAGVSSCASEAGPGLGSVGIGAPSAATATSSALSTSTASAQQIADQAGKSLCEVLGVRADRFDEWSRNAVNNLTGAAAEGFTKSLDSLRRSTETATGPGMDTVCFPLQSAAKSVTADTASVLVVVTVTRDPTGNRQTSTNTIDLTLKRVGDRWLISEVKQVS